MALDLIRPPAPRTGLTRRVLTTMLATIVVLTATMAPAAAYDRTWKYSGSFKAALSSSAFANTKEGTIKVTVDAGNCTQEGDGDYGKDFPYIKFSLQRQETNGYHTVGTVKHVYCSSGVYTYTYSSQRKGTYRLRFERAGGEFTDENLKTVAGTVYYW